MPKPSCLLERNWPFSSIGVRQQVLSTASAICPLSYRAQMRIKGAISLHSQQTSNAFSRIFPRMEHNAGSLWKGVLEVRDERKSQFRLCVYLIRNSGRWYWLHNFRTRSGQCLGEESCGTIRYTISDPLFSRCSGNTWLHLNAGAGDGTPANCINVYRIYWYLCWSVCPFYLAWN